MGQNIATKHTNEKLKTQKNRNRRGLEKEDNRTKVTEKNKTDRDIESDTPPTLLLFPSHALFSQNVPNGMLFFPLPAEANSPPDLPASASKPDPQ